LTDGCESNYCTLNRETDLDFVPDVLIKHGCLYDMLHWHN